MSSPHISRIPRPSRLRCALLAAAALAALSACAGPGAISESPGYPGAAPLGPTLDIQVFRQGTEIELANTTERAFGPSTLWLNRWYARPIDGLQPGETLRLPLRDFRDRYGEPFRAGGFFAIQRPDTLAIAELVPDASATILPLVVVGGGE